MNLLFQLFSDPFKDEVDSLITKITASGKAIMGVLLAYHVTENDRRYDFTGEINKIKKYFREEMEKIDISRQTFNDLVRNAFILLVFGLTLLEFGGRLSKFGPVVFIFSLVLLITAVYDYFAFPNSINLTIYAVIGMIIVIIWVLGEYLFYGHDTLKNPE